MPSPSISVVVPAHNAQQFIEQSIKAILNQVHPGAIEIIVVDDGSTDATARLVRSFPSIKYIYQENAGPAAARNRGARESKGEIIFFTDSDCAPQPDWVAKMIPHFQDTSVAVVAGSYGIRNGQFWLAKSIHQEIAFRHKFLMPQFPNSFGSYNFCIKKNVFIELDGFDESYRYPSGEDNDLSYKIIKAGYKIYFEKSALVNHWHTTSLQKYLREQYRHGFWRAKLYGRHPGMARGDDYTFWKDIVEIPLSLLVIGSLIFVMLMPHLSFWILCFSAIVLIGIEVFYGLRITPSSKSAFALAFMMFLRSFARSVGFLLGAGYFLTRICMKKDK